MQAPPAPLAQVLLVQVGGILLALRPVLDVVSRSVGGHTGHLSQQLPIPIDGLGARRRRGAGQSIGVLGGDFTGRQRIDNVGHLRQRPRPLTAPPRLPLRTAGVAAQHLHCVHTTIGETVQGDHGPRLGGICPGAHTAQRRHQRAQHPPSHAIQRQGAQLRHQRVYETQHTAQRIGGPHESDLRHQPTDGPVGPGGQKALHARHRTSGV